MTVTTAAPASSPVSCCHRPSAPLVCITGASSGIGLALAAHYAAQGWRLALLVRKEFETKNAIDALKIKDLSYRIYSCDVADISSAEQAGQRVLAQQGVPDVVIANAGISIGMDSMYTEDITVMARTFTINNVGMAATFQPFIQPMRERGGGTLVGVASVAAIRGLPGHGAYCASKAGVVAYCESLRGELRGTGVKVVTLLPGYIKTPLTERNSYPMPFLLDADVFAVRAAQAIAAQTSYRVIPWQMGWIAKLLRLLPNPVFDRLLAGRGRKHRQGE
jgi:short-subunit dehydrogenase